MLRLHFYNDSLHYSIFPFSDLNRSNRRFQFVRRFFIVKSCNKLDPPLNGALAWENWFHGIHSRLYCNDKYDIPRGTTAAEYYICDDSKGTWTPSDTVPDCTGRVLVSQYWMSCLTLTVQLL